MTAVVFDTLILSRKLAAAGLPVEQAQGMAAALAETLGEQIATRRDIEELRRELKRDMQDLETRIAQTEANLRNEIRLSEQRQTIRLGLMLASAVAAMAALVKLL